MDSYLEEKIQLLGEKLFDDPDSIEATEFLNNVRQLCQNRRYGVLQNLKSYLTNNSIEIAEEFKNISSERLYEASEIVGDMYSHCITTTSNSWETASAVDDLERNIDMLGEILFDRDINDYIVIFLNNVKTLIKDGEEFKLNDIKNQIKNREISGLENIEQSRIDEAVLFIGDMYNRYHFINNRTSPRELVPTGTSTHEKEIPIEEQQTAEIPQLPAYKQSSTEELVPTEDLLEIQRVENLIEQLHNNALSKEEFDKLVNERDLLIKKINSLEKMFYSNYQSYKNYEWDYRLNQEAIDELLAEGLVPGTPEYEHALRLNYGISGEIIPRKRDKAADFNWDPRLNQEAIDELLAEGLVPGTPEYEHALRISYGIIPIEIELNSLRSRKYKIEQLLTPSENLQEYMEIRDAYYKIADDIFNNLKDRELSPENIDEVIMSEINNHEKSSVLEKWNNPGKMKVELKEAIKQKILGRTKPTPVPSPVPTPVPSPIEPIETEQKKDKLWLKALAGTLGFATGIGVSIAVANVPVLGVALSIYAGARLAYNAAKLVGKIITKINDGKEPAIITKIKDKIPNKVKKAASVIFDKPKNPYFKWFVNGASIGYLVGNVFDIAGKIKGDDPIPPDPIEPDPIEPVPPEPIDNVTPVPPVPPVPEGTYDLSSLSHGFVSSTASNSTHLITEAGKNVTFDKSTFVDGVEWWHFKQANGQGYAWFPAEQVEKIIGNVAAKAASAGRGI